MYRVPYTVHIFREGSTYIAYVPELDVSSCGASSEEARGNISEAVQAFVEASGEMGTLDEILEEAGYEREENGWRGPEFISLDRLVANA
jgi:predicted RNase H-like HicB family nuclease